MGFRNVRRRFDRLNAAAHATGRYRRIYNRGQFAEIEVMAEPTDSFSVVVELPQEQILHLQEEGFLDWAVFGMLDVLFTAEPSPVLGLSLRIVRLDEHPVDSAPFAYRTAGREVGRRIIEGHRQARPSARQSA